MAKSIKTNIVEHLKKKGNYDPDVDDYNIDLLLENEVSEEHRQKMSNSMKAFWDNIKKLQEKENNENK